MTFDLAAMIADRDAGTPADRWVSLDWKNSSSKEVMADMRRENNVPLFEAEIIRLTARVAEYDRVCADLVAHWDSTDWVNKPHTGEKIAAIRAALSTPTEEPKT